MSCRTHKVSSALLTLARHGTSLADAQAVSVFHALKTRVINQARRGQIELIEPTEDDYQDFLNQSIWRTRSRDDLSDAQRASIIRRLEDARTKPMPDATTYTALRGLVDEMTYADHLYQREFRFIAGWREVTPADAEAFVTRTRNEWMNTPREERPHPPAEWVETYLRRTHPRYKVSPPTDEATLYAVWRAENDPDAFANTPRNTDGYVVFDLETTGFSRNNDEIIELGAIYLDADGNEEARDSVLFSPTPAEDGTLNTGPVDVHNITPDMVRDKPTFEAHAFEIRQRFAGRTLVAHNTMFDYSFLQSKLASSGQDRLPEMPLVDTMRVARSLGIPVENHKLQTLAEHFGVEYGNGHRADHDAEVCMKVLQRLREYAKPVPPIAA